MLKAMDMNAKCKDITLKASKRQVNVLPYLTRGYSKEQLEQIIPGWDDFLNVDAYSDINLSADEMRRIRMDMLNRKISD